MLCCNFHIFGSGSKSRGTEAKLRLTHVLVHFLTSQGADFKNFGVLEGGVFLQVIDRLVEIERFFFFHQNIPFKNAADNTARVIRVLSLGGAAFSF